MISDLEKFESSKKYPRHGKAYAQGGIFLKEEEGSTVNVRDVFLGIMKSVGSKLKDGKLLDLLKISRPAIISYPRTYLECIAIDFIHTKFLDKAAAAQDPVQRLKYVVAFFMAAFHRNPIEMLTTGPLNPILGETFYAEKRDGTKIFCEQISHHPPVSAYMINHPTNAYKLYGKGEVTAKMAGLNTIDGARTGETIIEFSDGGKFILSNPEMRIEGLMMGDRTLNFMKSFTITDQTNQIAADITFNYEEVGTFSKIGSSFKSLFGGSNAQTEKPLPDSFKLNIYRMEKDEITYEIKKTDICKGSGSWLSHLQIDGDLYWKVGDSVGDIWIDDDNKKLASDSKYRQDSKYIREKDFTKAQKEKEDLENLQRQDAKLRKANKETQ
jgi:hypothetical protein